MKKLSIVSKLWGSKASYEDLEHRKQVAWMNHPYIEKQYINMKISGHPDSDWLVYVKNKYIPKKLDYGLSLGCGDGGLERYGLALGICEQFDAFDVSEGAVEIAKAQAVHQGTAAKINYEATDINMIHLKESKYDIAFCSMSAHHFELLEHVFDEVNKSLKPFGLFVLNEYIGPSQFQFTDMQLKIMNDLLGILPADYKRLIPALMTEGASPRPLKERIERISRKWMDDYDPSEAIRSNEIISKLTERFSILEKTDYGGTLLHLLLQNIAGNFDERAEGDMAVLKLLCYIEEILIKGKVLPSDFALIVAQKQTSVAST